MNSILILGAGGHGRVVAEVAADCGYDKVDFLDDNSPDAIGPISALQQYTGKYDSYFVGIGNNETREYLHKKLEALGCNIPRLIHPTAYISRTAHIGAGTIVEPKAIVNANAIIGEGCIISVGSIIDHDSVIGDFAHINAGAICKGGSKVEPLRKLEAGEVIKGY